MRVALPSADRIRAKRRMDWETTYPILLGQEKSFERLLSHYIRGGGSFADHLAKQFRDKIDEVAVEQQLIEPGESVFDRYARVLPACLKQFCPGHADVFFDVGPQDRIKTHELMPASANENYDLSLPSPINMVLHRSQRPAFNAYSMSRAKLYVSPAGYQLFDTAQNWFWPSASSRTFSKLVTSVSELPTADHIVIIQDRFGGDNFAHFLFDWITRLGLFLESRLEPTKDCIFVMGGVPDQFHAVLLKAVTDTYGIEPSQFFFPEDGLNLRAEGNVYWFSDQVDTYMHPAQLAHSRSVDVIRKISASIPIAGSRFERIYISRGDTGRRRVLNEDQLWHKLNRYGFEMIRLADHPVEEQIALVRGASHIVAPHGMGLTHVSLHTGAPSVLELHNPTAGTDAFALMAKVMGCRYDFIVGTSGANDLDDFAVSSDAVLAALDRIGVSPQVGAVPRRRRNMVTASSTFAGTWSPGAQVDALATVSRDVPELFIGNSVMRHVRSSPDTRKESNCGNWWGIVIEGSRIYTASCWVWVPAGFDGQEVGISLGEWGRQRRDLADLTKRNIWQRLRSTVTAPPDATQCAIVIRLQASHESVVYSTCWQLEPGPEPSDYIATPELLAGAAVTARY
jgi:Glycosyltransferase 61